MSLGAENFCAGVGGNANYECMESIAGEQRICAFFVRWAIPLALRAPDIVEGILAGKQRAWLTLKEQVALFPMKCEGQRVQFGMDGA